MQQKYLKPNKIEKKTKYTNETKTIEYFNATESNLETFTQQFRLIRTKVSSIMNEMWRNSKINSNAIQMDLKELSKLVPALESGLIDFVGEMGFLKNLSKSQREEIKNLISVLEERKEAYSFSPPKKASSIGERFKGTIIYKRIDYEAIERKEFDFFDDADEHPIRKLEKH